MIAVKLIVASIALLLAVAGLALLGTAVYNLTRRQPDDDSLIWPQIYED